MIVKSVIVCLSLAAALPASAAPAPLATSTVIRIPELVTLTVGFVAPTEIRNLAPAPTSGPSGHRGTNADSDVPGISAVDKHVPGLSNMESPAALPVDMSSFFRRQIRINNYDPTNNSMTEPLFGGAPQLLVRRNKKAQAMKAAQMKTAQAAAQPSSAPAGGPLGAATPMQAVSGGIQGLGATRMEGSDVFHEALGAASDPMDALQDAQSSASATPSAAKPTYSKSMDTEPLPIGPGYTTDTMDTAPEQPPTKQKSKRHSFMMDLNALLPEAPSTTVNNLATPSPVQAWQNDALFELDSNRRPDPTLPLTSQNVTSAATNVTGAAQGVTGNVTKST
ncbi:hypothetical protein EVJ58_g8909 [Rhodofomes roseus]|uniref:Uncharacterized protein n=1 Tax=Rhodofomes roseus TaxID=34475 RepID=A0A4Y9XWA4_9APHY|nr:hypothetical protein EVJ58_g8909 [Rhodofomes roseus]